MPQVHRMRRGEATENTQNRAQRLHTEPMEMTAKNGENCKFETLEKHEIKANLGDFGVKKLPRLRENSASIDHQFNLDCSAISAELLQKAVPWRVTKTLFGARRPL